MLIPCLLLLWEISPPHLTEFLQEHYIEGPVISHSGAWWNQTKPRLILNRGVLFAILFTPSIYFPLCFHPLIYTPTCTRAHIHICVFTSMWADKKVEGDATQSILQFWINLAFSKPWFPLYLLYTWTLSSFFNLRKVPPNIFSVTSISTVLFFSLKCVISDLFLCYSYWSGTLSSFLASFFASSS